MKIRKQKVISILAGVFLLASFFVMPVAAADDYYTAVFGWPHLGVDDTSFNTNFFSYCRWEDSLNSKDWDDLLDPTTDFYWASGDSLANTGYGYRWTWPSSYGNSGYISFYLGSSAFGTSSYVPEDTVWVDPLELLLILPDGYTSAFRYRYSFRETTSGNDIGKVVGYSEWVDFRATAYDAWTEVPISIPRTTMTITTGGVYDGLAFFLEFECNSMNSSMGLGMDEYGVSVNYGKGHSPNYPVYGSPSGSNEIGDLGSKEDALLSGTEEGQYQANQYFSNAPSFILPNFAAGIVAITNVMSKFMRIGNIGDIVTMSLSLGLFATLLGLAASIVGAADRRARSNSRKKG